MRVWTWISSVTGLMLLTSAWGQTYQEAPDLQKAVRAGTLPPLEQRLPNPPLVDEFLDERQPGRFGGSLRMLMTKAKDTRMMTAYGYARLVKYNQQLQLVTDILEHVDVQGQRIYTLKLRQNHFWSDGHPFTSEDFRFWWEDIANNAELYPVGPPAVLKSISGHYPTVTIVDTHTIRYAWPEPQPNFLSQLAKAAALYIYAPAHYLKPFHPRYGDKNAIQARVQERNAKNWAQILNKLRKAYRNQNPDLPTLQPWVLTTRPPATRFVFERNPYYHKVDSAGLQLPYIDRWIFNITDKKLVALKAGTGEADLQGRYLKLEDSGLLKDQEKEYQTTVRLWVTGKGSQLAFYPNLTSEDATWRALNRDVRFRRALSLGINREEINNILYFGLASPGQNTVLPQSPLYRASYRQSWAQYDLKAANALLDDIGLTQRNSEGIRIMPDGRPLDIIIETASVSTGETDVLLLVQESWRKLGVKMHIKPTSQEILRQRVFSGSANFVIAPGVDNGLAHAHIAPDNFTPVDQIQYMWPKWGQYHQTSGLKGEAPDTPESQALMALRQRWYQATTTRERELIWHEILAIHEDQVFSIGIVGGVFQPIVHKQTLMNVPKNGIWNWDPGAHFGVHSPDTFWWKR